MIGVWIVLAATELVVTGTATVVGKSPFTGGTAPGGSKMPNS
jgi:hypothetical protein